MMILIEVLGGGEGGYGASGRVMKSRLINYPF